MKEVVIGGRSRITCRKRLEALGFRAIKLRFSSGHAFFPRYSMRLSDREVIVTVGDNERRYVHHYHDRRPHQGVTRFATVDELEIAVIYESLR